MLKIRISQVIDVQQNLKQQLGRLNNEIGDMEQVMQQLNGLSGMDEVQMALRRRRDQLEESYRTLNRMIQCIEKAVLYYSSCEERICDNAQQEIIVYRRHRIGISNLSNISGLLQSVFYIHDR